MGYETVLALISKDKDWGTHSSVLVLEPEEKIRAIEQLFIIAVQAFDDESASRFFKYSLKAIEDKVFLPLVNESGSVGGNLLETEKINTLARQSRIFGAMKLYIKLVEKLKESSEKEKQNTSFGRPHKAELLKTKKLILTEIMNFTYHTDNAADAEKYFQFWCQLEKSIHDEEIKMRAEVIRAATNTGARLDRLIQHYKIWHSDASQKLFSFFDGSDNNIDRILRMAIARNMDERLFSRLADIITPLSNCSAKTFSCLAKTVEQYSILDTAVKQLKNQLTSLIFPQVFMESFTVNYQPPSFYSESNRSEKTEMEFVKTEIEIQFRHYSPCQHPSCQENYKSLDVQKIKIVVSDWLSYNERFLNQGIVRLYGVCDKEKILIARWI